jgi:hypothetical protein
VRYSHAQATSEVLGGSQAPREQDDHEEKHKFRGRTDPLLARERTERDMLQKRCYGSRPSARREENMSARQIASRTLQTQFQARSSTQRRWSLLCFPASCAVTSLAKYTPIGTHAHTHTHPALGSTNDEHSWVSPGVDGVQGCTCTQNTYTHTCQHTPNGKAHYNKFWQFRRTN